MPRKRKITPRKSPAEEEAEITWRAEERRAMLRALDDVEFQHIPAAENAKRALEVAAVGDHALTLVPGTEADTLICELLRRAYERAFSDRTPPRIASDTAAAPDIESGMVCSVHVPDVDLILSPPSEPAADIVQRVDAALTRADVYPDFDARAAALNAEAMRYAGFKAAEANIRHVAHGLARLDTQATRPLCIRRQHLAEALVYFMP